MVGIGDDTGQARRKKMVRQTMKPRRNFLAWGVTRRVCFRSILVLPLIQGGRISSLIRMSINV